MIYSPVVSKVFAETPLLKSQVCNSTMRCRLKGASPETGEKGSRSEQSDVRGSAYLGTSGYSWHAVA